VVDGRPQARLHSCEGRSPSLNLVQICRIWFAGTSRRSLATCPSRYLSTISESGVCWVPPPFRPSDPALCESHPL